MAEASDVQTQSLYYCHECTTEIVPELPDFLCPQCHNGFIEPVSIRNSGSGDSGFRIATDPDSDEHSTGSSFDMEDIFEPSFASLSNLLLGAGGGYNPYSMETGGGGSGAQGSSSSSSSSSGGGGGGSSSSSSTGPSRRGPNRTRVVNTLLMGPSTRRSRLRGPERHTVLGPMLQDLIVSFSAGGGPMGVPLLSEELAGNPGDYVWGRGGFDAVITHLMSQLENTGPPPLTETQIQTIPTVKISQQQTQDKAQCSICMEDFVLAENVKQLRCDHCFHETCIKPWLQMHATCPVCRKSLTAEGATSAAAAPSTSGQQQQQPPSQQQQQQQQPTGHHAHPPGSTIFITANTDFMPHSAINRIRRQVLVDEDSSDSTDMMEDDLD